MGIENLTVPERVSFGSKILIEFELINRSANHAEILVDYVIFHQKANGKLAPKVFKLKSFRVKPNETVKLKKQHAIVPITTRKYYDGLHEVAIQVNGEILGKKAFYLALN